MHGVQPSSFISLYQQPAGGPVALYLYQTHNQACSVVYPMEKTLLAKSFKKWLMPSKLLIPCKPVSETNWSETAIVFCTGRVYSWPPDNSLIRNIFWVDCVRLPMCGQRGSANGEGRAEFKALALKLHLPIIALTLFVSFEVLNGWVIFKPSWDWSLRPIMCLNTRLVMDTPSGDCSWVTVSAIPY